MSLGWPADHRPSGSDGRKGPQLPLAPLGLDDERPVTLNGISDLTSRGDLFDRSIIFTLAPIGDAEKRRFKDVWQDFQAVRPAVLGALFDAVAMALSRADDVRLHNTSRNADFATWVVAAEPALPWYAHPLLSVWMRAAIQSQW